MRSAQTPVPSNSIVVTIARFGADPQEITVPVDSTVTAVLNAAGTPFNPGMQYFVGSTPAQANDVLENGDVLAYATSKGGA